MTSTRCWSSGATGCCWAAQTNRSLRRRERSSGWARADDNPVGGWYGFKKGFRGRFANYVPPVLEELGLAEVEHNARNNRMRARRPGTPSLVTTSCGLLAISEIGSKSLKTS